MPTEIKVPQLGESVVEATVGRWLKQEGDSVESGEAVVELETDKVDLEVPAEKAGTLSKIERQAGEDVEIGDVLGLIDEASASTSSGNGAASEQAADAGKAADAEAEASARKAAEQLTDEQPTDAQPKPIGGAATPVAQRMAEEEGVDLGGVSGSGLGGRITRQDVEGFLQGQGGPQQPSQPSTQPAAEQKPERAEAGVSSVTEAAEAQPDPRGEERQRLSRRRRTIAARLVEAQQTAAMLTTFNEIDMSAVLEMRQRRQDAFVEAHGIKLGFTSFFVKATIGALKAFPPLNAEIQGNEIVLKRYYDIGIAVGAEEGLVVPVLRDADRLSFAQIEQRTKEFVQQTRDGSLAIEDLRGGTFTITNGGVFGSLLSTPILNPPQVGILGLHKIEERPVVVAGDDGSREIAIRPMMYVALSYDHRIVDGREAVQFLAKLKELIEEPEMLLLAG